MITISLDARTREALAAALEERAEAVAAEIMAMVEAGAPDIVADASLRAATGAIVASFGEQLTQFVRTDDLSDQAMPVAAVHHYAQRIADLGLPPERLSKVFRGGQRLLVAEIARLLVDLVPARRLGAVLPDALAATLEITDAGQEEAQEAYVEAVQWVARRVGVGAAARVRWVLDGGTDDVTRATSLLGHPVDARNIALVLRAENAEVHRTSLRALRSLNRGREVLTVAQDERTVHAWAVVDGDVDISRWLDALFDVPALEAAFGEVGAGLDGFRASHAQALAAFRLVAMSDAGPRIAAYAQVAALAFVARSPREARAWVRWTLGDLAAPGPDIERLRTTLREYLAVGENSAPVAERMFVHRNTIGYRIGKATALLPRGLEGNRVDVALALELVTWFPEAVGDVMAPDLRR